MLSTSSNTDSSLASISSSPSSSFSSTFQLRYDVFISFRAEDTGKNFTGQLYAALDRSGIYAFKNDQKIEKGENIKQDLSKAIEESRFSIIIFSKTYASSTWCLDELDKIIKCKNELGQIVIPIFYDVNPSDVRNQTGRFREAFIEHEKAFRDEAGKVQKWREAMAEAGNIAGFDLMDRAEAEFIQDIVKDISNKLTPVKLPSPYKKLVGINWRLRKLCAHIGSGTGDVRIVGILGMGGIGKTTLARVVYEHLSRDFRGKSFLADIREVSQKGNIISLQNQLLRQIFVDMLFTIWSAYDGSKMIRRMLCNRKVLVILDDVDDLNQSEYLAGNRDWFGPGSRIIITTRNEHLLAKYGVDAVYKAESLGYYEALQLLSSKAFKNDQPPGDYQMLCNHVIKCAGGLPLALEVLGSSLYGRSVDEWTNTLERLKEFSDEEILGKLQISFDGLEETEQKIFLDIAYFFEGENRDYVTKILGSCDFFPIVGIKVLIEKCLISISKHDDLLMHDLLQEMAKKIVEKQDNNPGKRSRLWTEDETYHVLIKTMGTDAVEGINHKFSEGKNICLSPKAFSNMDKLRVLKIFNVHLPQGFDYLSNELRLLEWHGYPLKSFPSSFHPEKLVALSLKYSRVQKLWKGLQILNKLKFIDLSHSQYLTKTPNFVGVPNLESLILEGCIRLSEIHPSIGELKRIVLLNLKDCKNLVRLPSFVNLESLEVLILAGCSKLKKFPKVIGEMKSLEKLDISETMMEKFPPSIFLLMKNLKEVSFQSADQ